ncbi:DUF962 domain-containing protein [Marinicella gelatinilytica]|uniref:DUF962 domain-containing protein n=1 Tax=Marinicella gelatinilytica TaxID=2996017 RepID=UPI002260D55C|nr:DUF962 domain-containing protein [Marinicella gelatinilytica]MCX7544448.1 DUF962 domain-containing protein [Marinicella gelatinilytica]
MTHHNKQFNSFKAFYPFYLSQHQNPTCRLLHVIGSFLVILTVLLSIYLSNPWLLLLVPVIGYGFAWLGHFKYEKNRPATFSYPLYSLMGDWVMFWQIITGQLKLK